MTNRTFQKCIAESTKSLIYITVALSAKLAVLDSWLLLQLINILLTLLKTKGIFSYEIITAKMDKFFTIVFKKYSTIYKTDLINPACGSKM